MSDNELITELQVRISFLEKLLQEKDARIAELEKGKLAVLESVDDWKKEVETSVIKPLEEKIQSLESSLKSARVVINLFDDLFKDVVWGKCCNGRDCACMGLPTEPEFYIWQKAHEWLSNNPEER